MESIIYYMQSRNISKGVETEEGIVEQIKRRNLGHQVLVRGSGSEKCPGQVTKWDKNSKKTTTTNYESLLGPAVKRRHVCVCILLSFQLLFTY